RFSTASLCMNIKMKNFSELDEFDLLSVVKVVEPEMCGRSTPLFDGYRGQFFWHINGESCTDWLASYVFEGGAIAPGEKGYCKVVLAGHVKEAANNNFPVGAQFAIREGAKIVAIGKIIENHTNA